MSRYLTEDDVRAIVDETEARIKRWVIRELEGKTKPDQQLVVSDDDRKQIVSRAMAGMATYLQKEVVSKIERLEGEIEAYKIDRDPDELVNQYRRRLHETMTGDGDNTVVLKVEGKTAPKPSAKPSAKPERTAQQKSLSDFRKKTLFFNEGSSDEGE